MAKTVTANTAFEKFIVSSWNATYGELTQERLDAVVANLLSKQSPDIDQIIDKLNTDETADIQMSPVLEDHIFDAASASTEPAQEAPMDDIDALMRSDLTTKIQEQLNRETFSFVPPASLNTLQALAGNGPTTLDNTAKIALLLRIMPHYANSPAMKEAVAKLAEQLGMTPETLLAMSHNNAEIAEGDHKGQNVQALLLATFQKNTVFGSEHGFTGFTLNSLTPHGTPESITFKDKNDIEYTHENGKTSVKMPKGQTYGADIALKEAELHLASLAHYDEDGNALPLDLTITTHGKNQNYSRDLILIAAMKASLEKGVELNISHERTASLSLQSLLSSTNPIDENNNIDITQLDSKAVAAMESAGINVEDLVEKYNNAKNSFTPSQAPKLNSPLTNASDNQPIIVSDKTADQQAPIAVKQSASETLKDASETQTSAKPIPQTPAPHVIAWNARRAGLGQPIPPPSL